MSFLLLYKSIICFYMKEPPSSFCHKSPPPHVNTSTHPVNFADIIHNKIAASVQTKKQLWIGHTPGLDLHANKTIAVSGAPKIRNVLLAKRAKATRTLCAFSPKLRYFSQFVFGIPDYTMEMYRVGRVWYWSILLICKASGEQKRPYYYCRSDLKR